MRPQKVREVVLWLLGEKWLGEKEMGAQVSDSEDESLEGDEEQRTIPPFICGDVDIKVCNRS
jgi:hypothetical protein